MWPQLDPQRCVEESIIDVADVQARKIGGAFAEWSGIAEAYLLSNAGVEENQWKEFAGRGRRAKFRRAPIVPATGKGLERFKHGPSLFWANVDKHICVIITAVERQCDQAKEQ